MSVTGERMQERRKALGISADTLAAYLGVSRSTVFRYENGDIEKVPANLLSDIAKFLRTSEAFLMGWEDEEPSKESTPRIMQYYELLNDTGKHEALKRVKELTELPRYVDSQISSEDTLRPIAAHNDYIDEPGELEKMRRDIASLKRPN